MADDFKAVGLRLLARRDLSRAKLIQGLEKRGCALEEAQRVAEVLIEEGWLREELYVSARVRGWIRKGYTGRAIRSLARREGLPVTEEDIRRAYEELGTDESKELGRLLERRARAWGGERSSDRAKRRLLGAAARHGHPGSEVWKALDEKSVPVGHGDDEAPGG